MLGACGIQMGTRFLTADECNVHENYKEKVIKAKDIDTIVTGKRLGHPVRTLKNPMSREFFKKEYDSTVTNEELEAMGAGGLRLAAVEGDMVKGSCMCGQIAGMIKDRLSCKDIVTGICNETEQLLSGAEKWVK